MLGKRCRGFCGEWKAVSKFYFTGYRSAKSGKLLRNNVCKECCKLRNNVSRNIGKMQNRKLCSDEVAVIKRRDPRYFRKRVRDALKKSGLKKS